MGWLHFFHVGKTGGVVVSPGCAGGINLPLMLHKVAHKQQAQRVGQERNGRQCVGWGGRSEGISPFLRMRGAGKGEKKGHPKKELFH